MENKRKPAKKIIGSLILVVIFTMINSTYVHAQTDPDGDPDENVPFDGGISILVAAGVGYGVKKWRDSRQTINHKEVTGHKKPFESEEIIHKISD